MLSNQSNDQAVVEAYRAMAASERDQPEPIYVLVYSLMKLHRFAEAESFLDSLVNFGFDGYSGWTPASEFHKRIEVINSLKLPMIATIADGERALISVYGDCSGWNEPIINCLPEFRSRAQNIFGDLTPPINFYFFLERGPYNAFYEAMFGMPPGAMLTENNSMTGCLNTVVCCAKGAHGVELAICPDRQVGDVMHEYGHALSHTIFGTRFPFVVPQWFDEGTADCVAFPHYQSLFANYDERLKAAAVSVKAPTYRQMCVSLYREPDTRYAIAGLMVRKLVQMKGQNIIKEILIETREQGKFARAFERFVGMKPAKLLRAVVEEFWNP
jgi:hypothetical protein